MNTFLSSQQKAAREQYRQFARECIAPQAKDFDSHRVDLKVFLQYLGQLGYLGISVPPEYGGQGNPFLNVVLFVEALCEFEPGLGLTLATHFASIELIKRYGSQAHKSGYLPVFARGEGIASLALSEELAGTDLYAVETKASLADGCFYVSGKKSWVVNAEIASLLLVLACTNSGDKAQSSDKELGFFLVDVCPPPALRIMPDCSRLGLKSAYVNDLELTNVALAPANQLVPANLAWQAVAYVLDVAKVVIAASAVGLCEGALTCAAQHARTREQFGSTIGQFQAIQWKLADHLVGISGARLQTYRAAWSKDERKENFSCYAAMCKWYAAKVARYYSGEALQVLGAFGLSTDSPLERFYRDAKVTEICYGTSEFQKMQLVKELDI